jgi:hypothetical protein
MNDAYMSGIAALAGSATGALASSTWLTQYKQERAQRLPKQWLCAIGSWRVHGRSLEIIYGCPIP